MRLVMVTGHGIEGVSMLVNPSCVVYAIDVKSGPGHRRRFTSIYMKNGSHLRVQQTPETLYERFNYALRSGA